MLLIKFDSAKERYSEITKFFGERNKAVFVNINKVRSYYREAEQLTVQLEKDMRLIVEAITGKKSYLNASSPKNILDTLIYTFNIPAKLLRKAGSPSVSRTVLEALDDRYKNVFVRTYLDYVRFSSIRKNLMSYMELKPIPNLYNNEGDPLAINVPSYEVKNTYRLNTNNLNVQGIDLTVCDVISAPENWLLLQVDSRQIEPKIYYSTIIKDPMIHWLISQHDDVYYALADYCLRESVEYTESNLFITENLDRDHRARLKTLVNAGNYGTTESRLIRLGGKELGTRFYRRLVLHPHRLTYENEITIKIAAGERRVTSHFGDSVTVSGTFDHIKNCFINNPIQMDVSRLSTYSVLQANELIQNSELKTKVMYSFLKHDEDVYIIHQDAVKHAPELAKFREYQIEDWLPVTAEYKLGLNYSK